MSGERHPRQHLDTGPARPEPVTGTHPRRRQDGEHDEGGEPACWAHLVCPECGAMESEGHRQGCGSARPGCESGFTVRP